MDKGNKKDARRLHISCFESFDEMYFLRYPSESPFRGLSAALSAVLLRRITQEHM